jgi:peptidoglycan/LPS O-acetylase OafA/YrhL
VTSAVDRSLGAELVPPPPATADQYVVLDTLRVVGALCVLTTHTTFQSGAYVTHGVWGTMLARLDVGVAVFFVLSGFLLSRPFLARGLPGGRRPATGHYLWKRFLRIMPVYVLTVVVALSLIQRNSDLGLGDWVTTLLMLNTFVDPTLPYGLTHMWSLAVEVSFYLVLPLLMAIGVGRRLRSWRVLALLAALSALSVWWHLDGARRVDDQSAASPLQWLPSYLIWFCLGIGLALVTLLLDEARREGRRPGRVVAWIASVGRQPGVCWTAAFGVFLVAATPLAGPSLLAPLTPAQSLTKNLLYAAIGVLLVASGVFAAEKQRYTTTFGHLWLRRLGWISYSLFCLHMCVLQFVMWATDYPLFGGHSLQIWALTLMLSLIVSELVYRLVERPALRLKTMNVGRRGRRNGSTASAEASETSNK